MEQFFGKAEMICSNCGKRAVVEKYHYAEPCRFCGYKRTEMIRAIEDFTTVEDNKKCQKLQQPPEKCKTCTNEFVCHLMLELDRKFKSVYVVRAEKLVI